MNSWRYRLEIWKRTRYGADGLGKFTLAVAIIFYIAGLILHMGIFTRLGIFLFILTVIRYSSVNSSARAAENSRFMRYATMWKRKVKERNISEIFMCSRCGTVIRVPKGKGKIRVTCPKCGNKIIKNT